MKFGSITMIQKIGRQNNGSTMNHRHPKRHVPHTQQASLCSGFCDHHEVVMMDFLSEGIAITGAYYVSLLQKLREASTTNRREKLTKGVCLLQGNIPVHNSHSSQMEAWSHGYDLLPHPPYSPDLAPFKFYLFPFPR